MRFRVLSVLLLALPIIFGAGCASSTKTTTDTTTPVSSSSSSTMTTPSATGFPGVLPTDEITNKQIRITTAKGDIVFRLFPDTAPMAVSNMVRLASSGFYNGLIFHRVEKNPMPFVIQGGDPLGTGFGGPGYKFPDELDDNYSYTRGIVAMANSGSDTNGSQFFIMLGDVPLPKHYTIFGEVTEGMDVVDAITVGDVMTTVRVEDVQ